MNPQNLKEAEKELIPERVVPPPWAYPQQYFYHEEQEISLLEIWGILLKRKWQILFTIAIVTGFSIFLSFIMPKKFTSIVTLMPITSEKGGGGGASAMAAQLSSLPGVGGYLGSLSETLGEGKSKELVNILKSRTLAENVIGRLDLMKVFFANQYDAKTNTFHPGFPKFLAPTPVIEDGVRKFQKKIVEVELDKKSGLVDVEVTMKDPVLAAKIANAMIFSLQDFISNNDLTVEKRNRVFIEEQLVKNRENLLKAGKELNQFYGQNRISSVLPQLDVDLGSYQTSPKALEEFRDEFEFSPTGQKKPEAERVDTKVRGVPGQVYLEYLNFNRELLGRVHSLLTHQYELAKISEAKEDLAFQVLDKPEVMVRPSSPKVFINVALGFVGGVFLALFIAFFREYLGREKAKTGRV